MNTVKMEFEVPSEMLKYMSAEDEMNNKKIRELMIYTLIKDEKISFGKGAEILEMNKIDFIADLGELGISYFDSSSEELDEDLNMLDKLLESKK